jgi:hypothetical protein
MAKSPKSNTLPHGVGDERNSVAAMSSRQITARQSRTIRILLKRVSARRHPSESQQSDGEVCRTRQDGGKILFD